MTDTHSFTQTLALHVLSYLAEAQRDDRREDLGSLTEALGVRRSDVRGVLSQLHREGLVDVAKMRLSLAGFVLGSRTDTAALEPLRAQRVLRTAAA